MSYDRTSSVEAPRSPEPRLSRAVCTGWGWVWPAARVDLVDGVEQDQILHVGVLLEHRRGERLTARVARFGRRRASGAFALFVGGLDQALVSELTDQPTNS